MFGECGWSMNYSNKDGRNKYRQTQILHRLYKIKTIIYIYKTKVCKCKLNICSFKVIMILWYLQYWFLKLLVKEVKQMNVSYNNLWKLLIDKGMKKKDLRKVTGISTASMAKLGKNEHVTMEILVRICEALNCDISDIMEIKDMKENENA